MMDLKSNPFTLQTCMVCSKSAKGVYHSMNVYEMNYIKYLITIHNLLSHDLRLKNQNTVYKIFPLFLSIAT